MTNQGPQTIDTAVTAAVQAIANRSGGSIIGATWWDSPDSREWRRCRQYFVDPHPFVSDADVLRDPFTFDQALREWVVCRHCAASAGPHPGMDGGHADCPLAPGPWEGNPMHPGGTGNHYLVIKRVGLDRWEWRKRRCQSRELRQEQIAQLEGREVNIGGGMRGVEVSP